MNTMHDEAAAIRVYGAVALVLLFAFAYVEGSFIGMALAVAAAALSYLFQSAQFMFNYVEGSRNSFVGTLAAVFLTGAFVAFATSYLLTLIGA